MKVIVEADGGARGNPGPAGYGAVVLDAASGKLLAERAEAIGIATNNVAEYQGLIAGLRAAADVGATDVQVRMDSKLVVEQMSGRWQIKNPGLRPLAAQAAKLLREFDSVTFGWIPRERNKQADALANAAMDRAAGKAVTVPRTAPAAVSSPAAVPPPAASWEPRTTTTATRLILVRHGETGMNVQGRYSGRTEVPISERGVAQAAAAATRIAAIGVEVTAIVSSPLGRCLATAEAISAAVGNPSLRVEPDLVECDFGVWDGRTFTEVRERWPAELNAWLASTSVSPPGGESFVQVTTRTRRVVAGLLEAYQGETVVVVSHVSPLKIMLRDALGAGDALLHRLYLDPTGISVVDTWPDGGVAVRTVNDTAHLAGIATP